MPEEIVRLVLKEYPELKPLVSPPEVLTKDKRREEKSREEKGREGEGSAEGNPTRTPEQWADVCVATYLKNDSPMECLAMALASITGGADPAEMLSGIQEINAAITASAPGGKSNALVPSARNFFLREQWREPSNFTTRWSREPRENASQKKEERPAVASRIRMHPLIEQPPCEWREVLIEAYPDGVNNLPWGQYVPALRDEIADECKKRGILAADWTQPKLSLPTE